MKQIIFRIVLFTLPLLGLFIAEGLLPSHLFTYRPWEALLYNTRFSLDKTFHPNQKLNMKSVGQLNHHTDLALIKNENWITDKLGHRNDYFTETPDILLLGDSNVVGSLVTQDSTISNQLKVQLGENVKVYNIAPKEFSTLDFYLKARLIQKPKIIIYVRGERYIPSTIKKYPERNLQRDRTRVKLSLMNNNSFLQLSVFMDKILRRYSVNWVKARLTGQKGEGIPGVAGSNMYFLDPSHLIDEPFVVSEFNDVEQTAANIIAYKNYCDSIGADFIFIPVPKKSTIYYEYVPYDQQPDKYLIHLDSVLRINNVKTINTLNLYNNYKKLHTNKLLYYLDDPHLNANGIQVVTDELVKFINLNSKFLSKN